MNREEHLSQVRDWEERACQDCGLPFPLRNPYERSCPVCYKLDRDYKVLWGDQAFLWSQERLSEMQSELRQARRDLAVALSTPQPPARSAPAGLRGDLLRRAISLCHPDHHNGSERATEVTRELLALRAKKKPTRRKKR